MCDTKFVVEVMCPSRGGVYTNPLDDETVLRGDFFSEALQNRGCAIRGGTVYCTLVLVDNRRREKTECHPSNRKSLCESRNCGYQDTDYSRHIGHIGSPNVAIIVVAGRILGSARNKERKCCPGAIIRCCPQSTVMTFDNGTTDGESDAHTVIFRGVERFKESIGSLRVEPDSHILHRQTHAIVSVCFGSDQQLALAIVDGTHCIRCVPEQIQNDLL